MRQRSQSRRFSEPHRMLFVGSIIARMRATSFVIAPAVVRGSGYPTRPMRALPFEPTDALIAVV